MHNKPIEEGFLPLLPLVLGVPGTSDQPHRLLWYDYAIVLAVLAVPAVITFYLEWSVSSGQLWEETLAHRLMEGFWAFTTLSVAYVIYLQYVVTGVPRLALMAFGFLAMGVLDLFHAVAEPGSNIFVWFHSMSALSGSVLFALSLLVGSRSRPTEPLVPKAWLRAGWVLLLIVSFASLSLVLENWLPTMNVGATFSLFSSTVNSLAAFLFFLVGMYFLNHYRWHRDPLLLVMALGMLLLFESQVLFPLSTLWDPAWWVWHAIKSTIYLAILGVLTFGFGRAVAELDRSRQVVLDAYARLEATQASLVESEKLATLGQMAAGLAHEVRNPLGAISNCLGILKKDGVSVGERQELIEITEREADRIEKIVANTLSLARPQSAGYKRVCLDSIVSEALQSLSAEAIAGVEIQTDWPNPLPCVRGDADQLEEVCWNLICNGLQVLAGKGCLRVTIRPVGESIQMAVTDDGPGMMPEICKRIFDPFFSMRNGGTGLGLSIVQRIVKEHKGTIGVDSEAGVGTTVTVTLPATHELEAP